MILAKNGYDTLFLKVHRYTQKYMFLKLCFVMAYEAIISLTIKLIYFDKI